MKLQPLYINEKILRAHGACVHSRRQFRQTFGRGVNVDVTRANFMRAIREAHLPSGWLPSRYADHLGVDNYSEMEEIDRIIEEAERAADHLRDDAQGFCLGCNAANLAGAPAAWNEIQRLRRIAAKQQKAARA